MRYPAHDLAGTNTTPSVSTKPEAGKLSNWLAGIYFFTWSLEIEMKDERFEAIFADRAALEPEDVAAMWDGSTYKSQGYNVELAWDFWVAGSKSVPACNCYGSMFKD